jgi:hypothetical protein
MRRDGNFFELPHGGQLAEKPIGSLLFLSERRQSPQQQ